MLASHQHSSPLAAHFLESCHFLFVFSFSYSGFAFLFFSALLFWWGLISAQAEQQQRCVVKWIHSLMDGNSRLWKQGYWPSLEHGSEQKWKKQMISLYLHPILTYKVWPTWLCFGKIWTHQPCYHVTRIHQTSFQHATGVRACGNLHSCPITCTLPHILTPAHYLISYHLLHYLISYHLLHDLISYHLYITSHPNTCTWPHILSLFTLPHSYHPCITSYHIPCTLPHTFHLLHYLISYHLYITSYHIACTLPHTFHLHITSYPITCTLPHTLSPVCYLIPYHLIIMTGNDPCTTILVFFTISLTLYPNQVSFEGICTKQKQKPNNASHSVLCYEKKICLNFVFWSFFSEYWQSTLFQIFFATSKAFFVCL